MAISGGAHRKAPKVVLGCDRTMTSSPSSSPLAVRRRGALFALGLALLYSLVALLYLRPIWRVAGTRIAPDERDPVFNLWVLRWGAHQIRTGLPDFWDANIFFPNRGTLALSDHLFGPAAVQALVEAATGNPLLGYNLLFFASFVATAGAIAFVVRRTGASRFAAAIAGLLLAFCPFRLGQLNHPQMLLMPCLPLTLWAWHRLLASPAWRTAAVFLAWYALGASGGSYLAYMVHVPMLAIATVHVAARRRGLWQRRSLAIWVPTALLALAVALVAFLPYLGIGRRLGLVRSPEEAIENAATLASYLSPARASLWFTAGLRATLREGLGAAFDPFLRPENSLFPGWATTGLALVGLLAAWRRLRPATPESLPTPRRIALGLLLAIALGAWLAGDRLAVAEVSRHRAVPIASGSWSALGFVVAASLGAWAWLRWRWGRPPLLRWQEASLWSRGLALGGLAGFALSQPIAYLPLMRVVSGLDAMRVPARFGIFVTLALVHFAARGIDELGARWRGDRARRAAAVLLAAFVLVELMPRPLRWVRLAGLDELPAVDHWLVGRREVRSLLELPIRANAGELAYMYASTLHWKPLANGYSGVLPESHRRLTATIPLLPDAAGFDLLVDLGISHLVVHGARLPPSLRGAGLATWESAALGRRLELVHVLGDDRVYRVLPGPATAGGPSPASSSAEARSAGSAER